MSVWKGVTDFLESVDQKAGEIVERQRHGGGTEYEEDEEVEEEEEEEEFSLGEEPQQQQNRPQSSSSAVAANAEPVVPQGAGGGDGSHNGFPSPPTGSTTSSNGRRSTPAAAAPTADPTTVAADKDAATALLKKQERHYEDLLHDRQQRFDVLQQDYERLRHRQSETESKLNQTFTRYQDTQQQLEILQHQQQSSDEARSRLEQEVALLEQDNANLQSQLQQQRSTEQTLKDQTARSEYRLTELAKELSEYQTKSRILVDERDRQIEMLQTAAAAASSGSSPTGPTSSTSMLTDDERQRWIAEIADLKANLHRLEADAASFQQTRSRLSGQVGALEVERDRVKQNLDVSQSEVQSWKEVYESERNTHASTRRALTDAQAEIDDLRRQTEKWKNAAHAAGPTGSSAGALQGDQEVRLKELAALVMEKQSALEAKRSEAEQWRTRYELALREADAVGLSLSQAASSAVASTSLNNGSARIPVYDATTTGRRGATGPSDYGEEDIDKSRLITGLAKQGAWGKRAAEVAKGIDRVSLQTGSVLKRHAMLRVAITGYVFLLHVWVFFAVTLAGGSMGSERDGPKM